MLHVKALHRPTVGLQARPVLAGLAACGDITGVREITAHDAAPVAASFVEEQMTPLERFHSVTPDGQVSARLVSRHRSTARGRSVVQFEPYTLSPDTDAATCHRP